MAFASAEHDALQPEVEQLRVADDLDALGVGGTPPVDEPARASYRHPAFRCGRGLLVSAVGETRKVPVFTD